MIFQAKNNMIIHLLILMPIVMCDYQAVVAQIDKQTQLKQSDATQKNQLLTKLYQEEDILKQAYAGVVQKSTAAENAYTSYFAQFKRCEGLNPQTDFIGQISALPDDICLVAPIGAGALDVYTLSLQLMDLQYTATLQKNIVDEQVAFNTDYFAQLSSYTSLTQSSYVPLQAALTKYNNCMKQYATPSNPNPIQCKPLNEDVNAKATIYGNFRSQQISFGMASKGPVLSLEMKRGIFNSSNEAVSRYQAMLDPKLLPLRNSYKQCIANLQNIKITTNQALSAALQSRNNVSDQNDKIGQIYKQISNLLAKIKSDTAGFTPLVASLKAYFP